MKGQSLTVDQVQQIHDLRSDGLLLREIAERLGIATQTVHSRLTDPDGLKQRERKKRYAGRCEVCGAPTSGKRSGLKRIPRFCVEHGKEHVAAIQACEVAKRVAKIESLWAQGLTLRQISAAMGWTVATSHAEISELRAKGANLPYRRSPEVVAKIKKKAHDRALARAREKETTAALAA